MIPTLSQRTAISSVFFAHGFTMGAIAVELPLIKERLQIGDAELGRLLLAMAIGGILAMPFAGALVRRFGSIGAIRLSAIVYFGAVASLFLPIPYFGCIALFLLLGTGNGLMDVAMNGQGVVVERNGGRPIMSSLHGFWSVGGFAAAAFAWIVLDRFGSMAHLLGTLAIGILLLGVALAALTEEPPASDAPSEGGFSLPTRATFLIGLLTMVSMIGESAMLDWGAIYLRDVIHVTPGQAAMALFAFSAGMSAGRFLGDWVRAQVSAVLLTRLGGALIIVALGIIVTAGGPVQAVFGFVVGGVALSNLVPVMFSAAAAVPGLRPEVAVAGVATVGYSGFLIGPVIIGTLSDHFGLVIGLGSVVVFGLIIMAGAGQAHWADEAHKR